jgi:hypothetical protein
MTAALLSASPATGTSSCARDRHPTVRRVLLSMTGRWSRSWASAGEPGVHAYPAQKSRARTVGGSVTYSAAKTAVRWRAFSQARSRGAP